MFTTSDLWASPKIAQLFTDFDAKVVWGALLRVGSSWEISCFENTCHSVRLAEKRLGTLFNEKETKKTKNSGVVPYCSPISDRKLNVCWDENKMDLPPLSF
jgi:hypothetical protein